MEVDKKGILKFLEEVTKIVVNCECKDTKKVTKLFFTYIDEDREKFDAFYASLDNVTKMLKQDLHYFLECDPAAINEEEILLAYPGYKAIVYYRVAHELNKLGILLPSRIITEEAHFSTGIDIHPGARIDSPFFIDHGTGIVIGETTIIGHHVKIYQGVTLGALSLSKGRLMKGIKRHPTIKNYVTIYANASILGGDVTIGNNVTIGGNVFLMESITDNTSVLISKPDLIMEKK